MVVDIVLTTSVFIFMLKYKNKTFIAHCMTHILNEVEKIIDCYAQKWQPEEVCKSRYYGVVPKVTTSTSAFRRSFIASTISSSVSPRPNIMELLVNIRRPCVSNFTRS
jgi:hypothetical protein